MNPLRCLTPTPAAAHAAPQHPALLSCIDALQPRAVLVLGEDSLEILCSFIRCGCVAATSLLPAERPEVHSADLVAAVMPQQDGALSRLLSQARRALTAQGWIVLEVVPPATEAALRRGTLALREAGFERVHPMVLPGANVLVGRAACGIQGPGTAHA